MTQGGHWHHLYTTDFWNFWLRSQKFKKCCISLIKSVWGPKMPLFDFAFFRTFWAKKSIFLKKNFFRLWRGSKIENFPISAPFNSFSLLMPFLNSRFFRTLGPKKSIFWWKNFFGPKKSKILQKIAKNFPSIFTHFGGQKRSKNAVGPFRRRISEKNFKFAQFWSFWAENFRICF